MTVPRGAVDLSGPQPDLWMPPPVGTIGPQGGKVSRLLFGVTGDTRPMNCDDTQNYPTAILTSIFSGMQAAGVQFAVATGDHQFVCSGGYATAMAQLEKYKTAEQALPNKVVFPTMGNHECNETQFCSVTGYIPARFKAYMDILVHPNWQQPYYSFDVMTDFGLATFVFAADTAWDATQSAWLKQTLSKAANAKYLFIFRHYPLGTRFNDNNVDPSLAAEEQIITGVHYTMLITGHSHEYRHDTAADPSGRAVIMGLGGAPLAGAANYYGYLLIEQQAGSGNIQVRLYDEATRMQVSTFTLTP
jgi:hypothetical protein